MNRNVGIGLICLVAAIIFVAAGCSEDSTTPVGDGDGGGGGDSNIVGEGIDFAGFIDLVEEIAPPVYVAPVGAPSGESDSMWNTGDHPLLGKVFSEDEPMSLWANMNNLDNILSQISEMSGYIEDVENANDTVVTIEGQ